MSIGCISRSSLKEAFRGLILHVRPKSLIGLSFTLLEPFILLGSIYAGTI